MRSNTASVVGAVRWADVFPGLLLVRALRVAMSPGVIILAMLGVATVQVGWRLVDAAIVQPDPGPSFSQLQSPPAVFPRVADDAPVASDRLYESLAPHIWVGPLVRAWAWAIQPLTRLVDASGWRQVVGFLLAGVWTIAAWALFGGAIARIAALSLARGESIGPLAALQAAATRWTATAGAPTFSFSLIAATCAVLAVAGFLMRVDVLAALGGLFWFVALAFGVIGAGLTLLHLVGFPFMWATVAVERTDAFDAVSRAWAYSYSRPLHLATFVAFASLIGLLAEAVLVLLVQWAVAGTEFGLSWGAGAERVAELTAEAAGDEQPGVLLAAAGRGMRAWNGLLSAVPPAFAVAYLWSTGVGIYLLMRRMVDSTELDEAAFDEGSPEPRIPKLIDDPQTGVPQVDPAPEGATE
ncbi:MAG: hypothetical protein KF688_06605 [Pirellulales bacterium]|nr:hypothetical protein [Pirellulales bacterium]